MIMHWKKACAIYNLIGMKDDVGLLVRQIALATEMIGDNAGNISNMKECLRKMYQQNINTTGMDSDSLITIKSGLQYSESLWDAGNCIIAEQSYSPSVAMFMGQNTKLHLEQKN
jgi:hypothetical protein